MDANGIITTVAGGGGSGGYSGDGGAAIEAGLDYPSGVNFDTFGNMFLVDELNSRIRKVDTNGIITTVAGNSIATYAGDGGAATNASLSNPTGAAFDASGNLIIADAGNNCIRKVDTNGIITSVAGNGTKGNSDGGPANNAMLNYPAGLTVDSSGNLFVADFDNSRIREVSAPILSTLTLANITTNNIGNYSVIVSSSAGSVTSSVAVLYMPPFITVQPTNRQLVVDGSNPGFSVAVSGSAPFGYAWYSAGTNLVQSGTNTTFTLSGVSITDSGNYTVVVTNSYGSVTSQVSTLTVVPSIIT